MLLFSTVAALVPAAGPYSYAGIAGWLASIVAVLCLTSAATSSLAWSAVPAQLWQRLRAAGRDRALLALVAILLLALVLRLVALSSVPALFYGDEGEMGANALAIVRGQPDAPWFFGIGFAELPSLHFYLEALSIQVFGVTLFALRFVSALWGTFGVFAVYLAGSTLANRRVGILAALIAAAAPVDLQLSRLSLSNVETAVLATCTFAAFAAGLHRLTAEQPEELLQRFWLSGAPFCFALAGVACALSLYFYVGSRVIPIALAALCMDAVLRYRRRRRWFAGCAAVTLVAWLITFLPMLLFYVQHPHTADMGRAGTYFVLYHLHDAEQRFHVGNVAAVLAIQFRDAISQFFTQPDGSTFFSFGAPILLAPVAGLFVGGLLFVSLTLRRPASVILAVWFWFTLLSGGVLTLDQPYTPRIVALLPAVYLLAALSLDWFLATATLVLGAAAQRVLVPVTVLLLSAITISSIHDYFGVYFRNDPNPQVTAIANFIGSLPSGTYIYDLADGLYFAYGPNRYLGYRIAGEDLADPPQQVPALTPKSRAIAFIVFPKWATLLPEIEQRFPGGQVRPLLGYHNEVLVTTYTVSTVSNLSTAALPRR